MNPPLPMMHRSGHARCRWMVAILLLTFITGSWAQGDSLQKRSSDSLHSKQDIVARLFVTKCAGCHTIGGGKLTGPDLIVAATWSDNDLHPAIKRMEKNVGPLTDSILSTLSTFLRSPDTKDRIKRVEALLSQEEMATLAPASAMVGQMLFSGTKSLRNGGPSCIGCHKINGYGGLLGLDLSSTYKKMGRVGMQSAIEQASFKVMDATYRTHKITKQEAAHLTEYFSKITPTSPVDHETGHATVGLAVGLLTFLGIGTLYRYRVKPFNRSSRRS
ncbi:MAG: cytochrome c [bacterium]|nr:cytochrome c [bacterium]